jgi:hypothetical protein
MIPMPAMLILANYDSYKLLLLVVDDGCDIDGYYWRDRNEGENFLPLHISILEFHVHRNVGNEGECCIIIIQG